MDKETEELRRELAESTSARTQLASRVEELQTECTSLQSHVADQEVYIIQSVTGIMHMFYSAKSSSFS